MGTSCTAAYDVFLARIASDDWVLPEEIEIAQKDWAEFLRMAVFRFRFPRVSLSFDSETQTFDEEIGEAEIQVLGVYMKHEWIKRCVASWEEIKMLYSNKDFSQANHLDKLIKLSAQVNEECIKAQAAYSRQNEGMAFNFKRFAGKKKRENAGYVSWLPR